MREKTSSKMDVHWSAVGLGVLSGLVIQLILTLLSLVADLSSVRVGVSPWGDTFVSASASLWQAFSMTIAASVGAYIAVRIFSIASKSLGYLHGFVIGVSIVLLSAILSSTPASMWLGGVFHNADPIITQVSPLTTPPQSALRAVQLEMLLQTNAFDLTDKPISAQMAKEWQIQIEAGEREKAMMYLINTLGFPTMRAAVLTDQALMLAGNVERASSQARLRSQRNVRMLNDVSWTILISVVSSLIFASLGGMLGSIDGGIRYFPRHFRPRSALKK